MIDECLRDDRVTLGISKNGVPVWYDGVSSHAATHMSDTPGLDVLVAEVVSRSVLEGDTMRFHTDMGRVVGNSDLVNTDPGDEIVYAVRKGRDNYSVFNVSKQPEPSQLVTTVFDICKDGTYELFSAWIGPSDAPSFPGTERETADSREFWSKHALAWGTQDIKPSTKTATCPW